MSQTVIEDLRARFNAAAGNVRLITFLSPTCGPCRYGQGVVREIFAAFPDEPLAGFVVWVPVLPEDNAETALVEQREMTDPRLHFWYDEGKVASNIWSTFIDFPSVTWDVYAFYDKDAEWPAGAPPPAPRIWMHQLNITPATLLEDRLDTSKLAPRLLDLLGNRDADAAALARTLHARGQAVSARDGAPPHDPATWGRD